MDGGVEVKPAEVVGEVSAAGAPIGRSSREAIAPTVTLSVIEIDPQSTQFACELTITNTDDDEFEVVSVRPRLPTGLKLNEAVDLAEAQLSRRYEDLCERVGSVLTNAALATSMPTFTKQMNEMRSVLRSVMSASGVLNTYASMMLGRAPAAITEARKRAMKIEVTCSDDVFAALQMFPHLQSAPEAPLINYHAGLLATIEREEGFERSRTQNFSLKKGQQYKVIYIVNTRRAALSPTSFSLSVDMVFKRDDYRVSRMEAATITVPPSPVWLTLMAMGSAVVGAYITLNTGEDLKARITDFSQYTAYFSPTEALNIVQQYVVPLLTALIVYNIFDMTSLKSQVTLRRSWRSAIFVGFACGYLNPKILAALGALLS